MKNVVAAKKVYRLLEDFFQPEKYDDMAANGLLADNTAYFEKIYTATFSSKEVLQKLKEKQAHNCLLFTHHPGAQHEETEPLIYFSQEEKEFMKASGISHFNLHLPLDQINPYSPSISLAKIIGAVPYGQFFEEGGAVMGLICFGDFETARELQNRTAHVVKHRCKLYPYGGDLLMDGKIAIIAGGAEGTEIYPYLAEAGVGLLLTGVGTPKADWFAPSHEAAKACHINILSAGHYSTEKFALISMCRFFEHRGMDAEFIEETPLLTDL